jgi:hypothetical protein
MAIAVQPVDEGLTTVFRGLNEVMAEAGNLIKITFSVASIGLAVGGMAKLASGLLSLGGAARFAGLAGSIGKFALGAAAIGTGGLALGAGIYGIGKLAGAFADGTDSTPPGRILVGERGPEIIEQGGGNIVHSNDTLQAAARLAMGGGTDQALLVAINALGDKINNRPIQVNSTIEMNSREFGRSVNEHFGEAGSSPLRGIG